MGPVAGVVLGVIFLLAGGAKLASTTWAAQAAGIGAPRRVAAVLPYGEVVLGAVLVAGVARRPSAVAAGMLLVVFSGLLAVRLAEGKHPPCACFGGRTPRPIGSLTLVRNAAFLAVAVVAAVAR